MSEGAGSHWTREAAVVGLEQCLKIGHGHVHGCAVGFQVARLSAHPFGLDNASAFHHITHR